MLEMKTKWFSNSLAKQMLSKNDFILTSDAKRLYVVGYGVLTSSAKNTYNVEIRDEEENVITTHENLYLDAITKLILGTSPKAKANKEASEAKHKEAKQESKKANKECLLLTFNDAFDRACKEIESYKKVAKLLGKYDTKDTIKLTMCILKEAKESEAKRIKEAKNREELKSLKQTLELAKQQGNNMLVDAINEMITKKEQE